jgi:hypothetical protein
MPNKIRSSKTRQAAIRAGYRSGLEERIASHLDDLKVKYTFEEMKIKFEQPAKIRTYTPDFVLPNGIIVESKGRFTSEDRKKHELIKKQHPEMDIRFVFQNSNAKLRKGSPTTYAMWCDKRGFLYAEKLIPEDWIKEERKK